ncbi:Dihydrolipoyllysine-residue succinyltransferase component of 2-oxoglutarate dehydrogenase complex [BD1-7 clade bacterium]|uniref:Dihydrolipoyllysine-residue succinyltransferase component of 2-oxoglutarate dehydrogenase complex n=1 Tax=BD1-7 clade bacterium TaxID=2029982 RepID=A0A5S9Q923_9GAMM|nr:Dihydrolipoyllysine-residue succinyltransferase component of 2-oxoglutarate dehydrogenase complex [BD1-7 clade bacterium]CAA0114529.1 Dihydrolipoyllysine-residue succinyltransferase component of 2-oxoglutarate dehydrogenase complex [BD1-7 clade bacterium]
MTIEIKAPQFPESVADGSIATWYKQPGEAVKRDELIVDIETDKVVLEVVAPADGALIDIIKGEGDTVLSEEIIATFEKGAGTAAAEEAIAEPAAEPVAGAAVSPAARKLAEESGLDASTIAGSGKNGLVTKEDVVAAVSAKASEPVAEPASQAKAVVADTTPEGRMERRVPMTRMRTRIAERLLNATNETAMLTTFNEVNMQPVMELRNKYKDLFEKTHNGTRLGFMSFFVRAATEALKRYPAVNASIDGNDIVYHGYQDVGVAVSTEKGLVVPVLRDTDFMGLADIEAKIRGYGLKARDGKLTIDEMTGGTFTITNGGVFGSMMSTPILNPPQAAILGMHAIQERPMAVEGEVKILPMMYLALSYDHRLIDGKEAVQFLVAIKELLEDPARMLLDV